MKKSLFTTTPQWLTHSVTLPLATYADGDGSDGLNYEQQAACENLLGRNLISASAGTGKTTVLISRMRRILETYPGANVLMVSFTKKAVSELQQRIGYMPGVTVATFHGLAYRILKSAGKNFVLDNNTAGILTKFVSGTDVTVDDVRHALHGLVVPKETVAVLRSYLAYLEQNAIVTFDTMQFSALELLQGNKQLLQTWQQKFDFILVDEYMDSDRVQIELMELLSAYSGNLTVCGDQKQQIYSFRDAAPDAVTKFAESAAVYDLNINYRSNPAVLGLANRVMNTNKPLVAAIDGEPIYPQFCTAQDTLDEAKTVIGEISRLHKKGLAYKDMVVLYRSSSAASVLYQELLRSKIPVVSKSNLHTKYGRKPFSLVVKLFRYMADPTSAKAFKEIMPILYLKQERFKEIEAVAKEQGCSYTAAVRVLEMPPFTKRYVDDLTSAVERAATLSTSEALQELMGHGLKKYVGFNHVSVLEELLTELHAFPTTTAFLTMVAEEQARASEARKLAVQSDDYIQLMTIHAAKGMEFPVVFLIGANDGCLPSSRSNNLDEEKRLLYVAITRAKEQLFISYPRVSENHNQFNQASRFLREAFAV